jgi:outer membrane protein OmpA-like peptidoglycan-associated protein
VRSADVERLRSDLSSPAAQRLVDDPTVVLVVLGYADPTGGADLNKMISQNRANNAVAAMRDRLKLSNVMHAVAMGSSTLFGDGRDQLQKNRVVEVWAVMP